VPGKPQAILSTSGLGAGCVNPFHVLGCFFKQPALPGFTFLFLCVHSGLCFSGARLKTDQLQAECRPVL